MKLKHLCSWLLLSMTISVTSYAKETAFRLSTFIKPSFQQITLKIDPDSPTFSGETTITIDVTKATDTIGFYQKDLDIHQAYLTNGDTRIPLTVTSHEYEIQHGKASQKIAANRYKLHIVFDGKINTSSDGMYLSKFEGLNYVFTQFEDMYARRAFPSFDEPGFKIPYQMTIISPEKHTVLSNTLVNNRTVKDGWQTVEFNKTKPMPSYILALAVGELDSYDIPNLSVPGKIYTPKGQAARTKFAAKHTAAILENLESYFGSPYPYEKLDFIAVPNFTFGAMENAGLVTYRSSLLLLEDEPRLAEQSGTLSVIAHELAHMWYGNLVTMAWWDDLWLNEAFASWMASKVMMDLYPEQNVKGQLVQEGAFGADASPTVKPVKKVVRSQTDVMDGLGLNYSKGESILQLIESMVGEKAFQKGIQTYMKNNAFKNAQADDLWKVLSTVANFDVPAMMKTYLEQPSYPLVEFAANGEISQSRYHLQGAEVKEQTWIVPLAISYKKNGKVSRTNLFLNSAKTTVSELAEADWIFPNENAMGYMRWKVSPAQLSALLDDISVLNAREKKSLLYNTQALFSAGEIELGEMMTVMDVLVDDKDPMIGRAVVSTLNDFLYLVDKDNEAMFGQFAANKLTPWFERLGVEDQLSDSTDTTRLRGSVYGILSRYANTPKVEKVSAELANKYLEDPISVPRSIATRALRNMSRFSEQDWFTKLRGFYVANTDANIRGTVSRAMIFTDEQKIAKTLDFALSDHVSPANAITNVYFAISGLDDQTMFYAWLDLNFDVLSKKMPAYHIASMPEYFSTSCDADNIKLAEKFYADKKANFDGMARSYDIAMDSAKQCLSLKQSNQANFNRYLQVATKH
ncbi:M1 family metallopeptidase [Paraglaciecola arctica]|uniref:Aminopeptidase n=1 Tax=Paraglaciecola arctica BSs20135 TaxID=493475 RepID=K6XGG4_9ALTE|nr:M1 family metallopeptidase [Paraglaciecola arctica]GAC19739.1 cytosol alanyl aminopeptidase [Paraglaciecola arctica BSs20135]